MTSPTPTTSPKLPLVPGDFETLIDGLELAARGDTGFNYYSVRGELTSSLPYRDLRDQAVSLGRRLAGMGLPVGARVALVAETTPDFHRFFFACQYAGLVPVPVPLPINLGGKEGYLRHVRTMVQAAGASAAVASDDLADMLREATDGLALALVGAPGDFDALPESGALRPFGKDDPCYIQYSSGSTSDPKGVMVSQLSATSNARAIITDGLDVRGGDRCTSWLPLYHDMGLVGFCIAPLLSQLSVDYLSTPDFARRSLIWLTLISENRGTLAFSPTFGYDLCVRRASGGAGAKASFDLSSWRVAGIGGDMVRADVLNRFADQFGQHGFKRSAFTPSYGLAESTLAVSFAPLDEEFETDTIDLREYESTGRAVQASPDAREDHTRAFVVCGHPMSGHDLQIRDEAGNQLPHRRVGRLMMKGPSVTEGYFDNPEATAAARSADGWFDTGDLAYTIESGVVLTGRLKDLIICNGRNIWPQDIEWAVEESLEGVRSGDVAAFSVDGADGDEAVVTVVQCRLRDPDEREALRQAVAAVVRNSAGVDCAVVLAPHRSLPMTSSGKLSRAATKVRYLAGVYTAVPDSAPVTAQAGA